MQGNNKGDFIPVGVAYSGRGQGYGVNQWIRVAYTLQEDVMDSHYIFFNFDNGGASLASTDTTIYMDNFRLKAPTQ